MTKYRVGRKESLGSVSPGVVCHLTPDVLGVAGAPWGGEEAVGFRCLLVYLARLVEGSHGEGVGGGGRSPGGVRVGRIHPVGYWTPCKRSPYIPGPNTCWYWPWMFLETRGCSTWSASVLWEEEEDGLLVTRTLRSLRRNLALLFWNQTWEGQTVRLQLTDAWKWFNFNSDIAVQCQSVYVAMNTFFSLKYYMHLV